jgi:hypothetical protein
MQYSKVSNTLQDKSPYSSFFVGCYKNSHSNLKVHCLMSIWDFDFIYLLHFWNVNSISTTYVDVFFKFQRRDSHLIFKYQRNEWKIGNVTSKKGLCNVLSCILCIHILYHIKVNYFYSKHILLRFMIFRAQVTIQLKTFKCIEKMNFTNLNSVFSFNNQY